MTMRIGTKSLLFGCHQFLLHPFLVTLAWRKIYRRWPTFRQLVAIALHDVGYWGKPNMDGPEGEQHPDLAFRVLTWIGWKEEADLCLLHSRYYSSFLGVPPSALCWADKLGNVLVPAWLYPILGTLTGEIDEFTSNKKHEGVQEGRTAREFFLIYRGVVRKILLHKGPPEAVFYAANEWDHECHEFAGDILT
jgi:hypothetical protein